MRVRPWSFALLLITLCAAAVGLFEWRRQQRDFSDHALFQRLPTGAGLSLYLDVQAVRRAGLLDMVAGSRSAEETDYREFVTRVGFDYRTDLDTVVGWLGRDATNLFLLRGNFNWDQISSYVKANGAKCLNGFCSLETKRGKYLSLMPLSERVIAVGIGYGSGVAYEALQVRDIKPLDPPKNPIWLGVTRAYLNDATALPEGTRAFGTALKEAENVYIGIGAGGDGGGLEAQLRADFPDAEHASQTRARLEELTALLQKFFARDGQKPSKADLSGVLTSGRFEQNQARVTGRWPLDRQLLEQIAGEM